MRGEVVGDDGLLGESGVTLEGRVPQPARGDPGCWRGNQPQERSLEQKRTLLGTQMVEAGRKAWYSEGEMKFMRGAHRNCNGPGKRAW
jgi:hypothetical protein